MGRQLSSQKVLSYGEILLFWMPLGFMWLMMAVEQPALAAVIARMPDAETNLAAFGVVFAISLVAESPIIQMLSAATALAGNRQNYAMLLRFMHIMALGLTALHLLIGLTPLFDFVVRDLLRVPTEVADASRLPFIVMAPFSAAVGYRRLWQGVLIRHGKTWVVPISMVSRLGALALVLGVGFSRWNVSGAMLASIAISSAVVAAAIFAGVLNRHFVTPHLKQPRDVDDTLGWHGLLRFYVPLALTTVVFLLARPVVTFGIARAAEPERSLAVWPVVNGFLFIFNSIALSHQETAIALLKRSPQSRRQLSRFTTTMAISVTTIMLVVGLSPLGAWWFGSMSGLSERLLPLTRTPVLILAIVPGLVTYKAWYRALYVGAERTGVLAQGVVVYTLVLFALVFSGARVLPVVGVTVAAAAMSIAQAVENGFLVAWRPTRLWRRSGAVEPEVDVA